MRVIKYSRNFVVRDEWEKDQHEPMLQRPMYYRYFISLLAICGLLVMNSHAGYSDRRQVIVFAAADSSSGEHVRSLVSDLSCQLRERDTDVRFVDINDLPDEAESTAGQKAPEDSVLAELMQLRSKEQPEFEMLLVGKDGGGKARTSDPDALEDFIAQIDTMPMRRAEMRASSDDSAC